MFKANQREGEPPQGASTITQQLAKLLYTGDERRRRAQAARVVVSRRRWSASLGKGRIPQLYPRAAALGDGICGAEAAARHHLGKSASQPVRAKPPGWPAC